VLVAEDDASTLAWLSAVLHDGGYDVVPVRAAHELLATLEDSQLVPEDVPPFQAALCDVSLAGTGRNSLLSLLRRMNPEIPLVIMTCPGDPLTQAEAFRLGADAALDRPFDGVHLLTVLRIIAPPAATGAF
jgi:CheY-like chemotaxis protein